MLSVRDLRKLAAELEIEGRSGMKRAALLLAVERRLSHYRADEGLSDTSRNTIAEPGPRGRRAERRRGSDLNIPADGVVQATVISNCHPPAEPTAPPYLDRGRPIPDTYGDDRLSLMIKDPRQGYAYWELSGPISERFRLAYGENLLTELEWYLRIRSLRFREILDIPVDVSSYSWYVDLQPGRLYQAQLGFFDEQTFVPVLTSAPKATPEETVSSIVDENWAVRSEELTMLCSQSIETRDAGSSSVWRARFQNIAEECVSAGEARR